MAVPSAGRQTPVERCCLGITPSVLSFRLFEAVFLSLLNDDDVFFFSFFFRVEDVDVWKIFEGLL